MALTPTAQSSLVAGAVLWLVGWATFLKADHIPLIGKFINRENALRWVNSNKVLTLLLTEFVNMVMHPPSNPASTLFAIGGTAFNSVVVFILLPIYMFRKKKTPKQVLQTV